jgi:putative two-component system response regulator
MVEALDFTSKPTVLVVDDTADNLEVISGLLKGLYKIKVAANGEKGLQVARSDSPPDLILLDIMMPEVSGYEVCTQLKGDPATRHIPIIFLTALSSAEDERKGLELGAEDYVTKPISPGDSLAPGKDAPAHQGGGGFPEGQERVARARARVARRIRPGFRQVGWRDREGLQGR